MVNLKKSVVFVLGVITGVLSSSLYFKDKYRTKYRKEADDKVTSMEDYLKKKEEKTETVKEDPKEQEPQRSAGATFDQYGELVDAADKEHPTEDDTQQATEYNKVYASSYQGEKNVDIQVVDMKRFYDYEWHKKTTLLYFTEDGVVLNQETDEMIDDVNSLIGDSNLDEFKNHPDQTSMYVRNFKRGEDFEVDKVFEAYSEEH